MISRRAILTGSATGLAAMPLLAQASGMIDLGLPGGPGLRSLTPRFPGKGEMIVQRVRPPLLETPMAVFDTGTITPNDRFFVRWSGGNMPTSIDPESFRLTLRGAVRLPAQLTLAEVAASGEAVEITAINQCAGNSRGFSQPRVPGAQWGHGAMGNAVWRGVRLCDLLDRAGVEAITANCAVCHSPDMILNQPALTREQWRGTIEKMRSIYKASIDPTAEEAILDYLEATTAGVQE